jgi:hypothetical protein
LIPIVSWNVLTQMDSREEEGLYLLSCYWMNVSKRVVDFAISFYKLNEEEAELLRKKYLNPGSYQIRLVDED